MPVSGDVDGGSWRRVLRSGRSHGRRYRRIYQRPHALSRRRFGVFARSRERAGIRRRSTRLGMDGGVGLSRAEGCQEAARAGRAFGVEVALAAGKWRLVVLVALGPGGLQP